MNIEARKISMIQQILNIDNELFIAELERKILELLPNYKSSSENKKSFPLQNVKVKSISAKSPPIVDIRHNVSLDEIVAEQQTIPISYLDIQVLAKETEWEYSLKELLEAIN